MINLQNLKDTSSLRRFAAGSVVFKEGGINEGCMYVMVKGNASVYKHYGEPGQTKLAELNAGDFFGETSLFLNREHSADLVADNDVTAVRVDRNNLFDFFESQPETTLSLIKKLCERLERYEEPKREKREPEKEAPKPEAAPRVETKPPVSEPPVDLFPPGHKKYDFEIKPPEAGMVYTKKFECPFCLSTFEKNVLRPSSLHLEKTDADLRSHYRGVDSLYYEIITCPSCCFSALSALFEKVEALKDKEDALFKILTPIQGKFDFSGKDIMDVNALYAELYLAALCAPHSFPDADMITARIWHRLSWLYGDCGDTEMSGVMGKKALDKYTEAFQNVELQDEASVRLQLMIAELSHRFGNEKTASEFFFKVKMNKQAGAFYQRLAEDRINEIRS